MEPSTWTLAISALFLCLYKYYRKNRHDFKDWGIPQPLEVPFLGIIGSNLIRRLHISDLAKELYNLNKDAKYVGMHMLTKPVIVMRDLDLVKSVLIKNFNHYTNHKEYLDEATEPLFAKNLIAVNGDKWRELKQLLSPAFTSSKLKAMFASVSRCAENFTESFAERFAKEEAIDMRDAFTRYGNDVIASCTLGIEIDSIKDPNNPIYAYVREFANSDGFAQFILAAKLLVISLCPKLAKALGIKIVSDNISKFFVDVIGTTIKQRDEKGITRPDMLQQMMNARDRSSENLKMDLVNITSQVFLFFAASFEAGSSHMCLVAHEVAVNPEVQEKLHDEIDEIWDATDGKVTYEAISHMPYLDAVFRETLRLHPQFSVMSRICTKTIELPPALPGAKPYVLEPGVEVMIPVTGIHRDPAFYEDPTKFDPERFVGERITTSGDPTSLGFGMGPRMCIGNRLVILETKVLFFHLLRQYKLQPCAKTCLPLKYSRSKLVPVPAEGFWLKIRER